jgi:GNAT superfamily N-acetyltransferase
MRTLAAEVRIRPYAEDDEPRTVELLTAALGAGPAGERSAPFFRWKHLVNPFGRSFMLVAEADERIVGLRAFMRWRFLAGDLEFDAVRAVDTATHPDYQGRGIFTRLTLEALTRLEGEAAFVFNTPNAKSLPGYLKMGWRLVGRVPVALRVRRPVRFLGRLAPRLRATNRPGPAPPIDAVPAAEALRDAEGLIHLASEGEREPRLHTPRTLRYLRWRYGQAPLLDYRAVSHEGGGQLDGLAIFRVRPRGGLWEATVDEVLTRPGDLETARHLLRLVLSAARVDHATCSFASGTDRSRAARSLGFLPSGRGMKFVVRPLADGLRPDPSHLRSWALSLGDLEVF